MDSASFGILSSIQSLSGSAFMFIFMPILTKHFKDTKLLISGFTALIVAYMIMAFATNSYHLYIMVTFFGLCTLPNTTAKSILSKSVDPLDVGKVLAVLGALQALVPFIFSPFFAYVYRSTLSNMPNAFIFVIIGFWGLAIIKAFIIDFLSK